MTEFEAQTVAVAKYQLWASIAGDVIAALALGAVVWGGVLAYRNIRVIIEQLEISRWNTLLSFEQDMASRRSRFADIGFQMMNPNPDASPELLQAMYDEAKESYFNSLDRLASSILNGQFPDAEMKQDYRDVLAVVVRQFPDDFATGTHYRKLVKLYNKWHD
jgi:hypothetical protein